MSGSEPEESMSDSLDPRLLRDEDLAAGFVHPSVLSAFSMEYEYPGRL